MKQVVAPRQPFNVIYFYHGGDDFGCADFSLPVRCVVGHRLATSRPLLAHYLEGIHFYVRLDNCPWTWVLALLVFQSPVSIHLPLRCLFLHMCIHHHMSRLSLEEYLPFAQDPPPRQRYISLIVFFVLSCSLCLTSCVAPLFYATNLALFSTSQVRRLTLWGGRRFRTTRDAGTEYFRMMKCGRLSLPKR